MKRIGLLAVAFAATVLSAPAVAAEFNKYAARKMVSKSTCFKCHSVTRKKIGPSYQSVTEKYANDPEARAKIYRHITVNPTVKIKGEEKIHPRVRTKEEDEIQNVVTWLLSRKSDD